MPSWFITTHRANWTLNFRNQVHGEWVAAGKDVSAYPDPASDPQGLMDPQFDDSELAAEADRLVQSFQADGAREAGIFHHLITLPTYHDTALGTDVLSEGYFGDLGMLAYVRDVQRREIRRGMASVKHQDLAGSNIGDDHKEYFSGDMALLASGEDNTMTNSKQVLDKLRASRVFCEALFLCKGCRWPNGNL